MRAGSEDLGKLPCLHTAAFAGKLLLVAYLIERCGCPVDEPDVGKNITALHCACSCQGDAEMETKRLESWSTWCGKGQA